MKMLNCKGQKLKQSQTLKENCILSFALLFIVTHQHQLIFSVSEN